MIKNFFKRLFCLHLKWEHIGPGIFGQEYSCLNCNKIKNVDFGDYLLGRNIPISYKEK